MMKKLSLLLIISFLTAGCSIYNVDSKNLTDEFYPPKRSANDVAYLENVTQPHQVIATVVVNTERRQAQRMDDVIAKMKREAAILGADAITDIKTDATGTWKKLPAQKLIGNAYVRANFSAAVVVFGATQTTEKSASY